MVAIYEIKQTVTVTATAVLSEIPVAGVATYYAQQNKYVYHLTDHLGNVRATIDRDKNGNKDVQVLSFADYYPHGTVMPGREAASSPRYRLGYQGQEQDAEVGLYVFDLRQYDPRLGKWLSPDPYDQHWSPYLAMSNNPISFVDPDGGTDFYVDGMKVDGAFASGLLRSGMVSEIAFIGNSASRIGFDFDFAVRFGVVGLVNVLNPRHLDYNTVPVFGYIANPKGNEQFNRANGEGSRPSNDFRFGRLLDPDGVGLNKWGDIVFDDGINDGNYYYFGDFKTGKPLGNFEQIKEQNLRYEIVAFEGKWIKGRNDYGFAKTFIRSIFISNGQGSEMEVIGAKNIRFDQPAGDELLAVLPRLFLFKDPKDNPELPVTLDRSKLSLNITDKLDIFNIYKLRSALSHEGNHVTQLIKLPELSEFSDYPAYKMLLNRMEAKAYDFQINHPTFQEKKLSKDFKENIKVMKCFYQSKFGEKCE